MSASDALPEQETITAPAVKELVQLVTCPPSEAGSNNNDDWEYPFSTKKKRKRTPKVWDDYREVTLTNGTVMAECIHCKHRFPFHKTGSTEHLDIHLTNCFERMVNEENKGCHTLSQSKSMASEDFEYDHARIRKMFSHMILLHELPYHLAECELFNLLMNSVSPHYHKISCATVKKDCLASFELEKKILKAELKNVNRVSVTTDLWKSGENVSYMVVTCHYVDSNWNLQKRNLNFCEVPPPHSGLVLCDVLQKCLVEWEIEEKVWTVTVDNAAYNDVGVQILRENISHNKSLPLNGKFFHVRCYAHILNLLAQDGLSAIQDVIFKVRKSVKYVVAAEMRLNMFSEIAKQLELSSKKLILDCCTRWNATYLMLSAALDLKDVFSKYQQRDTSYSLMPSEEEWKKVGVVCSFLAQFNKATHLTPGIEYPTSNIFLEELFSLKWLLSVTNVGGDTCMIDMVTKMKVKLDKYWGDCKLLMSVAAVLDPRNKMRLIEFCFHGKYSSAEEFEYVTTVRETLHLLYNEYVEADEAQSAKSSRNVGARRRRHSFLDEYEEYLRSLPQKSELEVYLEEVRFVHEENTAFDALSWWRTTSKYRFRILAKMACDVLSIPIATATLESAFAAGSRVIDPHYASLGVDTTQVLLCAGDWLRARYGIKKKAKEEEEEEDIQEINLP